MTFLFQMMCILVHLYFIKTDMRDQKAILLRHVWDASVHASYRNVYCSSKHICPKYLSIGACQSSIMVITNFKIQCRNWPMVIVGHLLSKMPLGDCLILSSWQIIKIQSFWGYVLGRLTINTFTLSYMIFQGPGVLFYVLIVTYRL